VQSYSLQSQIQELKDSVNNKTNKVVVYEGKDGYTPVKGKDFFDGKNGVNAVSYSVTNTQVKEVPLVGQVGQSAYDIWVDMGNIGTKTDFIESLKAQPAPELQPQVDPETKDLQFKLSTDKYWHTVVECKEYRLECPNGN